MNNLGPIGLSPAALLIGLEQSKEGFALTDAEGLFTYMSARARIDQAGRFGGGAIEDEIIDLSFLFVEHVADEFLKDKRRVDPALEGRPPLRHGAGRASIRIDRQVEQETGPGPVVLHQLNLAGDPRFACIHRLYARLLPVCFRREIQPDGSGIGREGFDYADDKMGVTSLTGRRAHAPLEGMHIDPGMVAAEGLYFTGAHGINDACAMHSRVEIKQAQGRGVAPPVTCRDGALDTQEGAGSTFCVHLPAPVK